MKKILVWDLPIRLFHWTFAGSLSAALAIGFLVDDDSPLFQLHMLFGLVAAFALVLRLILGIAGSPYNRFTAMPLRPMEVVRYMVGALFANHDPRAETVRLPVLGTVIQMGEYEGPENGGEHENDGDD